MNVELANDFFLHLLVEEHDFLNDSFRTVCEMCTVLVLGQEGFGQGEISTGVNRFSDLLVGKGRDGAVGGLEKLNVGVVMYRSERTAGNDSMAFEDGDEPIRRLGGKSFNGARWPEDLDVG
jgi:hypothetical protein